MQVSFITSTMAATPIRPLFKGNSEDVKATQCCNCPCCKENDTEIKPEVKSVDNKGLSTDKFEKVNSK